jgi:hypothetical protein
MILNYKWPVPPPYSDYYPRSNQSDYSNHTHISEYTERSTPKSFDMSE